MLYFHSRDFWNQIQENPELIQQFVFILKNNEFDAYYFETPCVNENKLGEQVCKIKNTFKKIEYLY